MDRRFINELTDGEVVEQIFRVSEKQLRTNRNGNLYLQMRLNDRTGSLTAMYWNVKQHHVDRFDNGDYVKVLGTAQLFNGAIQVLCKELQTDFSDPIDSADFEARSLKQIETMVANLSEILRSLRNSHLRDLADCFLLDEPFMQGFRAAPAGIKHHHAWQGGLLEHVLSLMNLVDKVVSHYPGVDRDVLLMGAFLHDIGKIRELTYQPDFGYSDEGQLLGHLVLGVEMLNSKIAEAERQSGELFPVALANHLKHLILSHHGEYEFGSPKLPMTVEAIVLHLLDNLDSKVSSFQQLIEDDPNKSSNWTVFHPTINRKLYKSSGI